jgi:hypothetical protein
MLETVTRHGTVSRVDFLAFYARIACRCYTCNMGSGSAGWIWAPYQPGRNSLSSNLGGPSFAGQVSAGAVLGAIGSPGNSLPATEVEISLAWIANRPEACGSRIS